MQRCRSVSSRKRRAPACCDEGRQGKKGAEQDARFSHRCLTWSTLLPTRKGP